MDSQLPLPGVPRRRRDLERLVKRHCRWARLLGRLGRLALTHADPTSIRPADAVRLLVAAAEIEREAVKLLELSQADIDLSTLSLEELERLARGK